MSKVFRYKGRYAKEKDIRRKQINCLKASAVAAQIANKRINYLSESEQIVEDPSTKELEVEEEAQGPGRFKNIKQPKTQRKCCVPGCISNHRLSLKQTVTFAMPVNGERRKLWIQTICEDKWTPPAAAKVCANHFSEDDIIKHKLDKVLRSGPLLKDNAIPSIFYTLPITYNMMSKKCGIPGCSSNLSSDDSTHVSVFNLPFEKSLKDKWLDIIKTNTGATFSKYAYVCIKHFEESELSTHEKTFNIYGEVEYFERPHVVLIKGSVPSIFPPKQMPIVTVHKELRNNVISNEVNFPQFPMTEEVKNEISTISAEQDIKTEITVEDTIYTSSAPMNTDIKIELDLDDNICNLKTEDETIIEVIKDDNLTSNHVDDNNSISATNIVPNNNKFFAQSNISNPYDKIIESNKNLQAIKVENSFICNECGKDFDSEISLQLHVKKHIIRKFFRCNICGRVFENKHHLESHFITGDVYKRYKCCGCSEKFSQSKFLIQHQEVHSNEHLCHLCGSKFTLAIALKKHLKSHIHNS